MNKSEKVKCKKDLILM